MRRWFVILLLALLPLQFSWAAVAAYCGLESDAQALHLGHHEHPQAGPASVDEDPDPAVKDAAPGLELDGGHCHGSCVGLLAAVVSPTPRALTSHPVSPAEGSVRTLALNPPERPQWLCFA